MSAFIFLEIRPQMYAFPGNFQTISDSFPIALPVRGITVSALQYGFEAGKHFLFLKSFWKPLLREQQLSRKFT